MIFASRHITVTADHGTATLAFGFAGEPPNALGLDSLREFESALDAVSRCRGIGVVIVRSAIPHSFCPGLSPLAHSSLSHPADRAAFAWYGQRVLEKLANLSVGSVAFIDGECFGAGFELALACDYRLCVARPTTPLGFPERYTCFGGTARTRMLAGRRGLDLVASGKIISAREAVRLGLVNVACSERRSKIALRGLLDRLEARPIKPTRPPDADGLAAERRAFSVMPPPSLPDRMMGGPTKYSVLPFPRTIGILGNDPSVESIASAASIRGTSVVVCGSRSGIFAAIDESARRGFISCLEAEQVRLRVRASDTLDAFAGAELVFVAESHNPFRLAAAVRPRTVVCVVRPAGGGSSSTPSQLTVPFPFPRRLVHISFCATDRIALFPDATTDPAILSAITAWLKPFGYASVVFPVAARLLPRAA